MWDASGERAPGPYSSFAPSNIVERADGHHYALFFTIPDRDDPQTRGSCVMRTHDLGDPSTYLAWDGAAFALAMPSRYVEGATGCISDGTLTCGFLYSLSEDLITWTPPRVLKGAPTPIPPCSNGSNVGREYEPSLIDHGDATINCERSGPSFHLYDTRCDDEALDRDLARVPVTIHVGD